MGYFASLAAQLRLDISNFASNMERASNKAKQFSANLKGQLNNSMVLPVKKAKVEFKDVARIVQGIIISKIFYGGLNAIRQCTNAVWEFTQELEYAKIAYSNLFGDSSLAEEFINVLKDFAATTPFSFKESEAAAKRLLAYGVQYKNVMYVMQGILAASSMQGNPHVIESVSRALGQIYTKGRLMNEEMRQLAEAGIPAYEILQEKLGLTQKQLQNLGDEAIPASKAINALVDGMNERFGDVVSASSKTIKGIISNIKDNAVMIAAGVFEPIADKIKVVLNALGNLLFKLREILELKGIGGLFEAIFPPELHGAIRQFIANMMILGQAIMRVVSALGGLLRPILEALLRVFNAFAPILATMLNMLALFVGLITKNATAMKILTTILASAAAMWLVYKANALATLVIVKVVNLVSKALAGLHAVLTFVAVHPFWALLIAMTGVVVGLSGGFGKLSEAINGYFKKITSFNGVDPDKILLPSQKDRAADLEKFNEKLDGTKDSMDDLADSTGKATKAAKSLLSFDEVFRLNEPDEGTDKGIEVPDIDLDLPDMSGAFADTFVPEIPDFTGFVSDLGKELKEKLLAGGLGALLGAVLGGLLKGVLGAKVGAIAGALAGLLWMAIANALGLSPEEKVKAAITTGIGTALGAIIGGIFGGPMGAKIGAIIGTFVGSFWGLLAQALGVTDMQQYVSVAGAALSGLVAGLAKFLVASPTIVQTMNSAGKWVFSGFATSLGNSIKDCVKYGIKGAIASLAVGLLSNALVAYLKNELDLTDADVKNGSIGQSIGNIIGSITGMILGGPTGSLIGGSIGQLAGSVIGTFWEYMNNTLKGSILGGAAGLPIGALVGTLAGSIGGPLGAALGAAIGAGLGAASGYIMDHWDSISEWFANASKSIGDFVSNIGTNLSGVWNSISTSVSTWATGAWSNLTSSLGSAVDKVKTTLDKLPYYAGYALGSFAGLVANKAVDVVNGVKDIGKGIENFFAVTVPNAIQALANGWNNFWTQTFPNALNSIAIFVAEAALSFVGFFTVTLPNAWTSFWSSWDQFWHDLFVNAVASIVKFGLDAYAAFNEFFTVTLPNTITGFANSWNTFWTVTVPNAVAGLGAFFVGLYNDFISWGASVIDGFIEGFKAKWADVWIAIADFFRGFIDGFKDTFGIHSPAESTKPLGAYTIEGFIEGMNGLCGLLLSTIANIGIQVVTAIGQWFVDVSTNIATFVSNSATTITSWANTTYASISGWVQNGIAAFNSFVQTVINGISNWATNTFNRISSWAQTASNKIKAFVTTAANNFTSFVSNSISKIANFASNTISRISSWASTVTSKATYAMTTFKNSLTNGFNNALNAVSSFCSSAMSKISSWASSFGSYISNAISGAASRVSSFMSSVSSSLSGTSRNNVFERGHATGGVFNREHIARFAEGNKAEAIIPLENASAMQPFVDAVAQGLTQSLAPILANMSPGGQSDQLQPLYVGTLIADDRSLKELSRKMQVIQLHESNRRG